jgi:hypothetical protein
MVYRVRGIMNRKQAALLHPATYLEKHNRLQSRTNFKEGVCAIWESITDCNNGTRPGVRCTVIATDEYCVL